MVWQFLFILAPLFPVVHDWEWTYWLLHQFHSWSAMSQLISAVLFVGWISLMAHSFGAYKITYFFWQCTCLLSSNKDGISIDKCWLYYFRFYLVMSFPIGNIEIAWQNQSWLICFGKHFWSILERFHNVDGSASGFVFDWNAVWFPCHFFVGNWHIWIWKQSINDWMTSRIGMRLQETCNANGNSNADGNSNSNGNGNGNGNDESGQVTIHQCQLCVARTCNCYKYVAKVSLLKY